MLHELCHYVRWRRGCDVVWWRDVICEEAGLIYEAVTSYVETRADCGNLKVEAR